MSRMPEALETSMDRTQFSRTLTDIHCEGKEGSDTLFLEERPALIHLLRGSITGDNHDMSVAAPVMHTIARFGTQEDIAVLEECRRTATVFEIKESADRALAKIRGRLGMQL